MSSVTCSWCLLHALHRHSLKVSDLKLSFDFCYHMLSHNVKTTKSCSTANSRKGSSNTSSVCFASLLLVVRFQNICISTDRNEALKIILFSLETRTKHKDLHESCEENASYVGYVACKAEDELDQREWMEAVQGVTACLLNGHVDVDALSRAQPKPSRPTHSRQGSRAGLLHCILCCSGQCITPSSCACVVLCFAALYSRHQLPEPSLPC